MGARDMADDRKPQAAPGPSVPPFPEAFEDGFAQIFGYAGALVPDLQECHITVPAQADRDPAGPMGQRVVEEISDHVAQVIGATANRNGFIGCFDLDRPSGPLDGR